MSTGEYQPAIVEDLSKIESLDNPVKIKDKQVIGQLKEASDNMDSMKQNFIDEHKTEISDDDLSMFPRPHTGCDHCYGRGIEGWDALTRDVRLCRCILNRVGKGDQELLTIGEFRTIMNYTKTLFNLEDKDEATIQNVQGTDQENTLEGTEKQQERVVEAS